MQACNLKELVGSAGMAEAVAAPYRRPWTNMRLEWSARLLLHPCHCMQSAILSQVKVRQITGCAIIEWQLSTVRRLMVIAPALGA